MSLYPSLEDMKVDQLGQAQQRLAEQIAQSQGQAAAITSSPYPSAVAADGAPPYPLHPAGAGGTHSAATVYPALGEYMGLEFTPEILAANMPEYVPPNEDAVDRTQCAVAVHQPVASMLGAGVVAPLTGGHLGLQRAQVSHNVRPVLLCKGDDGRVGLRVQAINKGIFVCLVKANSPAALAGLRFGDQILQINDETVAGYTMDKVHNIFKKCPANGISLAIRDRPFERCVTLHKDSSGHIGFQYKDGEITALVKESSAARNGLLTQHHMLEVNGQNVVGLKDKDVAAMIQEAGNMVTITIMPGFIYKHMMKHMASSLITKVIDHSIPDL